MLTKSATILGARVQYLNMKLEFIDESLDVVIAIAIDFNITCHLLTASNLQPIVIHIIYCNSTPMEALFGVYSRLPPMVKKFAPMNF